MIFIIMIKVIGFLQKNTILNEAIVVEIRVNIVRMAMIKKQIALKKNRCF